MSTRLQLGDIAVDVVLKDIKNLHLSVYPPGGSVRISAPRRMSVELIRTYAITKLGWIKQQQKKIRRQERETRREYLDRESHYVWGRRYLLSVKEKDEPPSITLKHGRMILHIRPGTDAAKRQAIVDDWYRIQLRQALPVLLAHWELQIRVAVKRCFVRRMKTKWGSCNPRSESIRLNTDLARKPPECLEYIVVHEMVHLLEPTHNARFMSLMDRFMPHWRHHRDQLNEWPLRHEEWTY